MSALLAQPNPSELISNAYDAGMSGASEDLRKMLAEMSKYWDEPVSRSKAEMKEALARIAVEYSADDWDGDDALGIAVNTIINARKFMDQLPHSIIWPAILPVRTGKIAFQWRRGTQTLMLVSIDSAANLSFACVKNDQANRHGTDKLGKEIPSGILDLLHENFGSAA